MAFIFRSGSKKEGKLPSVAEWKNGFLKSLESNASGAIVYVPGLCKPERFIFGYLRGQNGQGNRKILAAYAYSMEHSGLAHLTHDGAAKLLSDAVRAKFGNDCDFLGGGSIELKDGVLVVSGFSTMNMPLGSNEVACSAVQLLNEAGFNAVQMAPFVPNDQPLEEGICAALISKIAEETQATIHPEHVAQLVLALDAFHAKGGEADDGKEFVFAPADCLYEKDGKGNWKAQPVSLPERALDSPVIFGYSWFSDMQTGTEYFIALPKAFHANIYFALSLYLGGKELSKIIDGHLSFREGVFTIDHSDATGVVAFLNKHGYSAISPACPFTVAP